jgi:REP element-mobilizing transposase RayT
MEKLFKYRPNAYHHVTFATKRRKPVLAGDIRQRVLYWFDRIAQENGFQLLERNTWLEHVHMLIFVRPDEDLSYVMNLLKGTCARQIPGIHRTQARHARNPSLGLALPC